MIALEDLTNKPEEKKDSDKKEFKKTAGYKDFIRNTPHAQIYVNGKGDGYAVQRKAGWNISNGTIFKMPDALSPSSIYNNITNPESLFVEPRKYTNSVSTNQNIKRGKKFESHPSHGREYIRNDGKLDGPTFNKENTKMKVREVPISTNSLSGRIDQIIETPKTININEFKFTNRYRVSGLTPDGRLHEYSRIGAKDVFGVDDKDFMPQLSHQYQLASYAMMADKLWGNSGKKIKGSIVTKTGNYLGNEEAGPMKIKRYDLKKINSSIFAQISNFTNIFNNMKAGNWGKVPQRFHDIALRYGTVLKKPDKQVFGVDRNKAAEEYEEDEEEEV